MDPSKIGRYMGDWTDTSLSDPGITILECLEELLGRQKEGTKQFREQMPERILEAMGYGRRPGVPASVFVQNLLDGNLEPGKRRLYRYEKFFCGTTCYEVEEDIRFPSSVLMKLYSQKGGKIREIPELRAGNPLSAMPFGEKPEKGDRLYLLFSGSPYSLPDRTCRLAVTEGEETARWRNAWDEKGGPKFARAVWSCYTENGYEELSCEDGTGTFASGGEIVLHFGAAKPCEGEIGGDRGYIVCCTLEEAAYDLPPVVTEVAGPVLKLAQKDTKAAFYSFDEGERIRIHGMAAKEEKYLFVYVEERAGEGFREYRLYKGQKEPGRYYEKRRHADGSVSISFFKGRFGYGPPKGGTGCIRIASFGKDAVISRRIGRVQGYDGQEIFLPGLSGLETGSFCLEAARQGDVDVRHDFLPPGSRQEDALFYVWDEDKQAVVIKDCGGYEGAELFLCSARLHRGAKGNVRKGNRFLCPERGICFFNPSEGTPGADRETYHMAGKRFEKDMGMILAAVTGEDYERLAMRTPGLALRKAAAYVDGKTVKVTVLPYAREKRPKLSELYRRQIYNYLDQRRLLGVRLEIQEPEYIPVDIYADLTVDENLEECRKEIETMLHRELDGCINDSRIGAPATYAKAARTLGRVPFITQIHELSVTGPGSELCLDRRAVCYVNEIVLDMERE